MEMDLLSITRTAAMIYAEENLGNRKTETIRRKFVESIFVLRENKSMTIMTIIDALEEELSITYSEQEVLTLIKENDSFEIHCWQDKRRRYVSSYWQKICSLARS